MRELLLFFFIFCSVISLPAQKVIKTNTYAVIIGISDYENKGIEDLQYANKDAVAFADFLKSKAGGSVPEENIKLFTEEAATNAAIYNSFSWLIETVEQNDVVYIYFAGHGDMESETAYKLGFLLTYQTPRRTYINNAIRIEDLNNYANTLALKAKVFVITDACHSGSLISTNKQLRTVVNNQLTNVRSKAIRIASCKPDQLSMEDEFWGGGRGVFSYYLVNGMLGFAEKNSDGIISVAEIKNYLDSAFLKDSLLVAKEHKQNPVVNTSDTTRLAVIDTIRFAQIKRRVIAPLPAPVILPDGNKVQLSDAQLLDKFLKFLNNEYIEGFLDFKKLLLTPEDKLLGEVIQQTVNNYFNTDDKDVSTESRQALNGVMELERRIPLNSSLWQQFNNDFVVQIDSKTQNVINDYLEGDEAELERRRYYNSKNNGYDVYPGMFKLAMKLCVNNEPLYKIFKIKLHYFTGVALRLKIPTVENPQSLIDSAFAEQQTALKLEPDAAYIHQELGTLYLYKKQYKLSEQHYTEATIISPDWVLPWASLMALYTFTKDTTRAIEAYTIAKKIQPDFQSLFVNAGILNEQKNNLLAAEEMYRKSIKLNSRHYFPFERLGFVYMTTTSYAQADSFFYEADIRKRGYHFNYIPSILVAPNFVDAFNPFYLCDLDTAAIKENDAIAYFAWGLFNYKYGNKTGAEAKFKKAIALDPQNPLAFHHLGKILYEQKRWQEGDLIFNFAVMYHLSESVFDAYVDSLNKFMPSSATKECAIKLFKMGKYNGIEDHYYLGTLYEYWHHYTEAEQQYRKIIALTPDFIGGYWFLWRMLEQIARYEEAEKIIYAYKNKNTDWGNRELRSFYKRMMDLFPENPDWFFKAGSFLYQLAADNPGWYRNDLKIIEPDETTPSFLNPSRARPSNETESLPFADQSIQIAELIIHPYTEAIEFFLKADSLIDNSGQEDEGNQFRLIEINDHLGDLYVWQGLKELAGRHYEKAIRLQTANTGIRLKAIDVHDATYHFSDALAHLEVLAEKKELNYAKEVLLAKYYIHASKFKEAEQHLRNAESIHPYKRAEIKDLFGRLALLAGKPIDAIKFYKEYLVLNPNDHEAMYSIARMYAKTGNKKEAWKWLKTSMDHGFLYDFVLRFDSYWDAYRKEGQWNKLLGNYKMKEYKLPPTTIKK